jgi:hypothetical protein
MYVLHVGTVLTILEADLITCPDESPWSCRLANCGFCKAEVRVAGPLQDSDKIDYQIAKFVEQRRLSTTCPKRQHTIRKQKFMKFVSRSTLRRALQLVLLEPLIQAMPKKRL